MPIINLLKPSLLKKALKPTLSKTKEIKSNQQQRITNIDCVSRIPK